MHNLFRIQNLLILSCLLVTAVQAYGQINRGNYNYLDFQKKNYYFGLTLGTNSSAFNLLHSERFILNDSFAIAEAGPGPGFDVNVITNLKIGEYFDFRFTPGFSFTERKIRFQKPDDGNREVERKIESVYVQAPFHVRFKSAPYRDMRAFVIGGVKYTYDVASNARVRRDQANTLIKISPHDFSIEVGAGVQFFFPFFIFSPEIKFSQGLSNILIYNGDLEQSRVLEKVLSRTFTLSLHFEG